MPNDENRLKSDVRQLNDCASVQEFRLKAEILGWSFPYGFDEFASIFDQIDEKENVKFLYVLVELIERGYFDKALDEVEFYQDYYIAKALDPQVNPAEYARHKILEKLLTSFSFSRWSCCIGNNKFAEPARRLASVIICRIRDIYGDSPLLKNAERLVSRYRVRGAAE